MRLNVDAYPRSSNAYDSLGEAHADDGSNAQPIVDYREAVQLYANNRNAMAMLRKLDAH